MNKDRKKFLWPWYASFFSLFFVLSAQAQENNILGEWITYDLTGAPRTIIQFYHFNHEYRADIIKLLPHEKTTRCSACLGKNKNAPLLGLTIIKGLVLQQKKWAHGKVLDTDSGNEYQCQITLSQDGNTMYFHAYIGAPFFGKTVRWQRIKMSSQSKFAAAL